MEYYAKKKTGKYTNSDTESNAGDGPIARPTSHMYGPPTTSAHHFFPPQYTRYSQPSPSHSGESILYTFEPSYSHVSQVLNKNDLIKILFFIKLYFFSFIIVTLHLLMCIIIDILLDHLIVY